MTLTRTHQHKMSRLAARKRFSRNDVLLVFADLEARCGREAFSRILDAKESLGFSRDAEPQCRSQRNSSS